MKVCDLMTTARGVSPEVREENERTLLQQHVHTQAVIAAAKKTVEEIHALHNISSKKHSAPSRHPYYDSEQFKHDKAYFDSADLSGCFTFRDFCFWFSHAYHDPALPPPKFGDFIMAIGWVVMIVEGIRWLCS